MATQITAFTAIPNRGTDSVLSFSGKVTTFLSELVSFRSSVNTIVGEMNADHTKVTVTNPGLIAADLSTVGAAQFSPALITGTDLRFIEGEVSYHRVQTGKNLVSGMRVALFPLDDPLAVTIKATVLDYVTETGEISLYHNRVISEVVSFSAGLLMIPAAPDFELDFSSASYTQVTPALGTKSLTVEAHKSFVPGMQVLVESTNLGPLNYMHGVVTGYTQSTGALTMYVDDIPETPVAESDWTIQLSSPSRSARSLGVAQNYGSYARVLDTAYQNTSGKPIYVVGTFMSPANPAEVRIGVYLLVGPSSSNVTLNPVMKVCTPQYLDESVAAYFSIGGVVPPGWWYKLKTPQAGVTLSACYELS